MPEQALQAETDVGTQPDLAGQADKYLSSYIEIKSGLDKRRKELEEVGVLEPPGSEQVNPIFDSESPIN